MEARKLWTSKKEKPAAWGATGFWNCHRKAASDTPSFPTNSPLKQAKNTVLDAAYRFRRAPARRCPGLTVQISVRAANQPHGLSRPFSLSHSALDSLLATAVRLECRR